MVTYCPVILLDILDLEVYILTCKGNSLNKEAFVCSKKQRG